MLNMERKELTVSVQNLKGVDVKSCLTSVNSWFC